MVKVEFVEEFKVKIAGKTSKMTYPALMIQALDAIPPMGLGRELSRRRNKAAAAIEEAVAKRQDYVDLEDAELITLQEALAIWSIAVRHPGFDKFWDYIIDDLKSG